MISEAGPDLSAQEVWAGCSDVGGRLLPRLRSRAVELRCRRGHLVAYLLRTPAGDLWARRDPWVERDSQHGWDVGWADEEGPQPGRCPCREHEPMDPALADWRRRTMHPSELRRAPRPDTDLGAPEERGTNPFA